MRAVNVINPNLNLGAQKLDPERSPSGSNIVRRSTKRHLKYLLSRCVRFKKAKLRFLPG